MLARRHSDRGSVLLISIILVIIIIGLAGSYLVVANVQSNRTVEDVDRGRARVAAEDGIDHMRVYLLGLVDPNNTDPSAAWDNVLGSNNGTPSWASSVSTPEGSYTVRIEDNMETDDLNTPEDESSLLVDGDGTVMIESTGFGTDQGTDGESHVIRCVVTLQVNDPTANFAIITGGDLDIYGNQITDGTLGSVHTNEDLTLQGSANISQSATASATTTQVGSAAQVGDDFLANQPVIPIEPVDPTDYRPDANYILTSDGRVLDGATGALLFDFNAQASGNGNGSGALPRRGDRRVAMLPDGRVTLYAGLGAPPGGSSGSSGGGVSGGGGSSSSGGGSSSSSGGGSSATSGGSGSTSGGGSSSSGGGSASSGGGGSSSGGGGSSSSDGSASTGGGSSSSGGGSSSSSSGGGSSSSSGGGSSSSGGSASTGGGSSSSGGGSSSGSDGSNGGGNTVSFNGFTWSTNAGWSTVTSGWVDGMYYIEGSIDFNHGGTADAPWRVTLVAEGDIEMQGNPYLQPYYNNTELFVAGRDVYARGTGSNAEIEGLILAHEQVDLSGNITYFGRIVAESAENTAGSCVAANGNPLLSSFGGSVHVQYNGDLNRSLVTDYRLPVRSWNQDTITNTAAGGATDGGGYTIQGGPNNSQGGYTGY